MKRQFHYLDDVPFRYALGFFRSLSEGFRVEQTGSSITLVNHRFCWILASEPFAPWHLGILSKVKAEVKRNAAKVRDYAESDGEQFKVNPLQFRGASGRYDIEELDLTAAYLSAAVKLGLLSGETVEIVKRLPKRWRLRILGAIAVRRRVVEYDATGRQVSSGLVTDPELRHCWFSIVAYVDRFERIMVDAAGPGFVFYWYDNFFCRSGSLTPSIRRTLNLSKVGYRLTAARLEFNRTRNLVLVTIDGRRRFWLPLPDLTRAADVGE